MNLKSALSKFFIIAGLVFFIYGCKGGGNGSENNSDTIIDSNDVITEENLTFYLIPSPKDMFAFTNDEKLSFSPQVLNAPGNADKYIDTKSRELGFGIYSADLAYTAAFSKTAEAANYLKIVRDLSDKIGISTVFDESLVNRFDNIQENKDSLMKVTNDTYYDIVRFLEDNERKSTLALISTGGWLESLYIVSNIVGQYSPENKTIQLVADQKLIFENLMLYLNQNKNDDNIKSVIAELQPIKAIYDQLKEEKTESGNSKPKNKGYIVGGGSKIVISKEQFEKLKETIGTVRNKLAGNNV
jgi:hypothetical protein